jgi:EAL domain-containing protein (putative c-di-GMP-specific phosphodiesterase class I)
MSRGFTLPVRTLLPPRAASRTGAGAAGEITPPRERRERPGLILLIGGAVAVGFLALDVAGVPSMAGRGGDLAVVASSAAGTAAMVLMAHRKEPRPLSYRPLALALALAGMGLATLDLAPWFGQDRTWTVSNVLFVVAAAVAAVVMAPAFYRRLDSRSRASAVLDGGIMLVAGTTILLAIWRTGPHAPTGLDGYLATLLAAALFASAGMAAVAGLSMRAAPGPRGIWAVVVGVLVIGFCWIVWVDRMLNGLDRDAVVTALFAIGLLIFAYAWMTWSDQTGGGRLYETVAGSLADWLPAAAILSCVAVAALPHGRIGNLDPAPIGIAVIVLMSVARQRLLILSERWVVRRLAGEMEERAQAMLSLARLEQADTLEATADRICVEALRLDAICSAAVYAFGPSGTVVPLAVRGGCAPDEAVGQPVPPRRAAHIRTCAGEGTWVDTPDDVSAVGGPVLAEAFAPMRWDDRVIGVVAVGTARRDDAPRLKDRLSTLSEFGVVSAALMGPALVEEWRVADIRALLTQVIDGHAYRPVFQPVVMLKSREIVGYEALTRFADGTRPDKRFLEAHTAGMSVRLEMACVADQLEAAAWLPQGTWVSLNVSPALASAVVPLVASLERADRDVVIEITEHVEVGDYRKLVSALELIRGRARLAVDDAGAGYAGLRHILELRPHFVKLDVSLVRNVDTDPARQAMVAGMAHFARNSGCELIAEGIETDGEAAELIRLGIGLGQGYLFGRPEAVA